MIGNSVDCKCKQQTNMTRVTQKEAKAAIAIEDSNQSVIPLSVVRAFVLCMQIPHGS